MIPLSVAMTPQRLTPFQGPGVVYLTLRGLIVRGNSHAADADRR
jgi:hypothetical protein